MRSSTDESIGITFREARSANPNACVPEHPSHPGRHTVALSI